jgi:transposase-like protein
MPQMQLPFFPDGATEINSHIAIIREGDQVSYIYGHLPIFTHNVKDISTFRMIISQLYLNGSVKQSEICRTFGVTRISVKRSVKLYREKGAAGFYEKRRGGGATVLTPEVLKQAQQLLDEGMEIKDVAEDLGIKKDTLRKAVNNGRLHIVSKKK